VERGETVRTIASRLEAEGLIRSPLFLRILAKLKATETSFQSGSYLVSSGSSALQVHNVLVSGREILHKVTIPEGWTVSRIAALLESSGITEAAAFLEASANETVLADLGIAAETAEGYLFPDTYLMPKQYSAEKALRLMAGRFFEVLESVYPNYRFMKPDELYQKVVLASVIEREYVVEEEAPLMASVFYNRLEIDMPLQSCATVAYALSEEMGRDYPDYLTLRDLEVESFYNTYMHRGLPPGPISNPGRTALEAAFFPDDTDYLFFLLKNPETGAHEFTQNYGDHLDAKNLYLKKS
jgi:UPF0755 protein